MRFLLWLALAGFHGTGRASPIDVNSTDVFFHTQSADVQEFSIRKGKTAAHVYVDSIHDPYLFIAFPSGNSGVGLWFKADLPGAKLYLSTQPELAEKEKAQGIALDLKSDARSLRLADSVLGSMRFIRDRELGIKAPKEVQTKEPVLEEQELHLQRLSLNGLVEYELDAEPVGDTKVLKDERGIRFESPTSVHILVKGYSGEAPVTPIAPSKIFKASVLKNMNSDQVQAFSFLLYKEKLEAGSPRYLSRFGRDSIYTLHGLMAAMQPETVEDILAGLLSGSHPTKGLISHEQSEGDFASFDRLQHHQETQGNSEPLEDYKMIDGDFAFAAVMGEYMKLFPKRVPAFLKRADPRGISLKQLVRNNFEYVIHASEAFVEKPIFQNLIRIRKGETVGNWRDSENGLGGGVYPFDVNAAFVPAALHALSEVYARSGDFHNEKTAKRLKQAFQVWNTKVFPLFEVRIPAAHLVGYGKTYWKELGPSSRKLPPAPIEDLEFPALSLSEDGKPVTIMHSDDSLVMAFGYPSPEYLRTVLQRLKNPFPYGLATPVGILVANPIFASREWQLRFDETKYHGRVIWTMQENFLIFGIRRQLERKELGKELRDGLSKALQEVERLAESRASGTELFSPLIKDGKYVAVPFAGDAKSNSNQLWSHLRIASPIKP